MIRHAQYNDLLYQEISKALHDEALLEATYPSLYQKSSSDDLKVIIKKLMDANKRHQELLDTAALSIASHSNSTEKESSTIAGILSTIENLDLSEQAQWDFYVIPALKKVIHQQMAGFETLASLTKKVDYSHLSNDFLHLTNEAAMLVDELQKTWSSTLEVGRNG